MVVHHNGDRRCAVAERLLKVPVFPNLTTRDQVVQIIPVFAEATSLYKAFFLVAVFCFCSLLFFFVFVFLFLDKSLIR